MSTLAEKVRADIRAWKIQNSVNYAAMAQRDPEVADYIIDLIADTSLEELDDEGLERVVRASTAENLTRLGYTGARSNAGTTVTPFYTVLLYAVGKEFGWDAVNLGVVNNFRGFRNTTEIRKFYADEAKRLTRRLSLISTEV